MAKNQNSSRSKGSEEYLDACAQLLCKAAYKMCREYFGVGTAKEKCDPKLLKEACSAVKEAVAVSSALGSSKDSSGDEIRVLFSLPEEYTQ
ncbi:MAG: hypothetical protein IKL47_14155 [Clostridia bacterium]|nr:hypothetical protein [Clostridia bacterium]